MVGPEKEWGMVGGGGSKGGGLPRQSLLKGQPYQGAPPHQNQQGCPNRRRGQPRHI